MPTPVEKVVMALAGLVFAFVLMVTFAPMFVTLM